MQVHVSPLRTQIWRGCSTSTPKLGSVVLEPLHFSRCTMTALRRLACCSVLLSSDSSLLGKVVIRTKSMAAIEGWAAITKCRRSDTLKDTNTDTRHVLHSNCQFFSFTASSYSLIHPIGLGDWVFSFQIWQMWVKWDMSCRLFFTVCFGMFH